MRACFGRFSNCFLPSHRNRIAPVNPGSHQDITPEAASNDVMVVSASLGTPGLDHWTQVRCSTSVPLVNPVAPAPVDDRQLPRLDEELLRKLLSSVLRKNQNYPYSR